MGIFDYISGIKKKIRQQSTVSFQKKATKLQALRQERLRLEGQKKILDIEAKEKERIAKAKLAIRESSPVRQFVKRAMDYSQKVKAKRMKKSDAPIKGEPGIGIYKSTEQPEWIKEQGKKPYWLK